ncbi:hypothetical protein J5X84_27505 [Streptosporangiaceae bacterium NEAU-GS5]|nr:hypothetical protein [Streptosporangiaceae bacterium NEAU-GS5]
MRLNRVEQACRAFNEIFELCEGCFVDTATFVAGGDFDYLDVRLVQTKKWDLVSVLLEDVRFFSISKPTEVRGSFFDELSVTYLPRLGSPWPDGVEALVPRFDELPELFWTRFVGPVMIEAISARMTVSVSQPEGTS